MLSLDIMLLRSFVAVARTGSIKNAALQVGRTQSAVSMQMQRLEAVIGNSILHRTGNGVSLTATGDRLLVHAERIIGAHDEAVVSLSGAGLQGSISFGCPEDYLTAFLPAILRGFSQANPKVDIEVLCAPTSDLHPMLHRRRIDLALISLPEDTVDQLIAHREPFVWVGNEPIPAILANLPVSLALSAPDTLDHRAACAAMERAGRPYRIAFASNSLSGLLAVTRSGQAISVVTRAAVPADLFVLSHGLPPLPTIGMRIGYASSKPSGAVSAFGRFVDERLRHHSSRTLAGNGHSTSERFESTHEI